MIQYLPVIQVAADSTKVATSTTAANTTIPNNSRGEKPRMCLLVADGDVGVRAVTGETPNEPNMIFLPANTYLILNTGGNTSIRHDAPAGTPNLYIIPLENQ